MSVDFVPRKKKEPSRISVVVSDEFLLKLKQRALMRNVTLRRYITGILTDFLRKEDSYQ